MVNEMRKWIDLVTELDNDQIKYFGKVSPVDQKWLEQKGRKSYSGGELQPMGGIDYIEIKPEFQGKGVLRKIVMDNVEVGKVKFVTASEDLRKKLKNYGTISYDSNTDITTLKIG